MVFPPFQPDQHPLASSVLHALARLEPGFQGSTWDFYEWFDQSNLSHRAIQIACQEKGASMTMCVLRQARQGTSQAANARKTATAI